MITVETLDTRNTRDMTDGVMTVAHHQSVVSPRGLYFSRQIYVRQHPQRLAARQDFRLHVFHQGVELWKQQTIALFVL